MKTLIRLFFFMVTMLLIVSCLTEKKVAESTSILPLSHSVQLDDASLVYGLPRTVFTVIVEMERVIEVPGPYARYADDLLGLDNVIKQESESWTIDKISITDHNEIDPSELYVIKSNTDFFTNVLKLKKEGIILDLNPELFSSGENQTPNQTEKSGQFLSYDLGSDRYFNLQRDTAYRRLKVDSTFIRIPYIVEKKRKLSIDKLAEKAATRLMEMRDGKHLILTGEANVFPQNEAAINEMNRLEKGYTELFTGKVFSDSRTISYHIIPEKNMVGNQEILFKFSDLTGNITGAMKGGVPVTIEFIPELKTKDLTIIDKKDIESLVPEFDKLFYRVPDVVNIKIKMGDESFLNSRRLIYQFGEVIQLPSNYVIGR
jgi:Domain of unknown function (DUF4831)